MALYGIIAEYNPFHKGHSYQMEKVRQQEDFEGLVVCMSGNFTQRGAPALVDKWNRAKTALELGANLVLELPVSYAIQPAHLFAEGGVKILNSVGVDVLAFGTEGGTAKEFHSLAHFIRRREEDLEEQLSQTAANQNYASAYQEALEKLGPPVDLTLTSNNQLGLQYTKAIQKEAPAMSILPIPRRGAGHGSRALVKGRYASATALREALKEDQKLDLRPWLPTESLTAIQSSPLTYQEDLWPFLRYQILSSKPDQLREIYQMKEGLDNRLLANIGPTSSLNEYREAVVSKRYTYSFIDRLLTYVLLQIREEDVKKSWSNTHSRILGFDGKGREILRKSAHERGVQLVSNINKKNAGALDLDIRAGSIYQLAHPQIKDQDYTRFPILEESDF